MPSTFFGLNIARSGMSTYNVWLNTTAHNISNVKTVGYTRQTVNQSASKPISFGTRYGMVGSGTEALDIVSERDVYYDAKYRLSNSDFGKYETFSYYMKGIENSLYVKDSETGGLTNAILEKHPKSDPEAAPQAAPMTAGQSRPRQTFHKADKDDW